LLALSPCCLHFSLRLVRECQLALWAKAQSKQAQTGGLNMISSRFMIPVLSLFGLSDFLLTRPPARASTRRSAAPRAGWRLPLRQLIWPLFNLFGSVCQNGDNLSSGKL